MALASDVSNSLPMFANPFHWPLEFPDIMERGGFDVVLGNPPWERIKIQEAGVLCLSRTGDRRGAQRRRPWKHDRYAARCRRRHPRASLFSEFETAKRIAEATSVFARLLRRITGASRSPGGEM